MTTRTTTLRVVKPDTAPKDERTGLLNPAFKYTRAAETDIRKLFAKVRRELAAKGKS